MGLARWVWLDVLVYGLHELYYKRVDGELAVVIERKRVVEHDMRLELVVVGILYLSSSSRFQQLADVTPSRLVLVQPEAGKH